LMIARVNIMSPLPGLRFKFYSIPTTDVMGYCYIVPPGLIIQC
jgi:hypothetical protein